MLNSSSVGLQISADPVQEMTVKYPRVLVIKAAFSLLKDGKAIEHRDLEKTLQTLLSG
ncbi:MAG: hypothetical protein PHD38_02625 [Mesotoga sp.]|uniref:hypothetical protein n=1 Tax=unclassified Mesotoga TaxID=1184398 RepID=UPI00160043DB|nr:MULTISPECIES: hypothetical protein [unclassified Mesotoga]MDI9368381.1 hypothetical protein [Thermotogota bacterium]NLT44743.1 hypothetical protein [Thermotogaceae bacterium]MDD2333278.1 hypothetical protein [Mesotoga sp.]MDD3680257.1 hypothetical protein [Mesotoga sp.]MDD4206812.1 hypothetical protein [Mesotoga sp.]